MATFRGDVFKASILAVLIVSGLGAASYLLQAHKPALTLDLYTSRGGEGQSVFSGGVFFYNETVTLKVYIKESTNTSVKNALVEFQVDGPPNSNITLKKETRTDAEGVGILNLPINEYPLKSVIGIWNVAAKAQVGEESIEDSLTFEVKAFSPFIDVYTCRGGNGPNVSSKYFFYNETVTIYAHVTEASIAIENVPVEFQMHGPPNSNIALEEEKLTNDEGIGIVNLTIPYSQYKLESVIGIWNAVARAQIFGENITDSLAFEVKDFPPPLIDVYTSRGGIGLNALSAPFYSNETVTIYAHVTDTANVSLSNVPVEFLVQGPTNSNITLKNETRTDAEGMGVMNLNLTQFSYQYPQVVIGVWNVIATVQNKSSDTLAFEVKTPPTPLSPSIDLFTDRGGRGLNKGSQPYYALENVTLYAEVTNGTHPIANIQVAFALVNFGTKLIWIGQGTTNSSGIATFSLRMANTTEWLGTWIVYANVEINNQVYIDTLIFECKPAE